MTMKDQMEPTPRRRGSVLIGVGVIFVAAALALLAYNLWDAYRGGQEASGIVSGRPPDNP
jgi:flagellar basal body-associated protein FliL